MAEHDETIPHEAAVEGVVDDEIVEKLPTDLGNLSTHVAIADPGTPGATYAQAEATATNNAVKGILAVLRDANLIPT